VPAEQSPKVPQRRTGVGTATTSPVRAPAGRTGCPASPVASWSSVKT
jgi:hypothetical protein